MITRKKTKKEIKEDAFVAFFIQVREYIKNNQNYLFIAVIALIVIAAGFMWYSNNLKSTRVNEDNMFSEGISFYRTEDITSAQDVFKNIIEEYGNSREGAYSRYFLGKCFMSLGENTKAIASFREYLKKSDKYPLYKDAAQIAIATAFENEHDFISSAEIYANLAPKTESDEIKAKYFEKAAESYKLAGKKDKAIEMYQQALKLLQGPAKSEVELRISILKG